MVDLGLRRYVPSPSQEDVCPSSRGYHNAVTMIGRAVDDRDERGYLNVIDPAVFADDNRWPMMCAGCGRSFTPDDKRQVWQERVYRRPGTGDSWRQADLPVGAMLDGFWLPQKGPDGVALVVVLPPPDGDARSRMWHVDGPSRRNGTTGPGWAREGDPRAVPPTVTASPSILTDRYHGFLRDGALSDPL